MLTGCFRIGFAEAEAAGEGIGCKGDRSVSEAALGTRLLLLKDHQIESLFVAENKALL